AVLAKPRNPDDEQTRINLPELVGTDMPALERPGAKVLDQDVCVSHELAQEVLSALVGEIQGDDPLVAGGEGRPKRDTVFLPADAAHSIATEVYDLDDVGRDVVHCR